MKKHSFHFTFVTLASEIISSPLYILSLLSFEFMLVNSENANDVCFVINFAVLQPYDKT